MEVQPDFKEFLKLLNENKAEYLIVGSYALAFHGSPRYTGDMDIYVKPEPGNAGKIMAVLGKFGFSSVEISAMDFSGEDKIVQLGVPPVRIDLMTSLTGVSWEEAFSGSVSGFYDDIQVRFIGREELIKNKKAVGRKKDLADIESIDPKGS